MARHRAGNAAPARACALPECDARRRVDYDGKKIMVCACKVRAQFHVSSRLACLTSQRPAQIAYYCCKEHQVADRKRRRPACKAALAAAARA
jgi:hypothetical protein